MKRTLFFGSVGMMALIMASPSQTADKTKSEQAFDRLTSLKGEWKGETDGVKTTLIYTLTADGSVLMEQCRPEGGPEMITMFTVDGDHLIATSVFNCPHHGIEIAGRFSQHRVNSHARGHRASDPNMDL